MNFDQKDEPAEEDKFLPDPETEMITSKHRTSVVSGAKRDLEAVQLQDGAHEKPYDPFKERSNPNPTTDCETMTHLLKASLGSGILAMPLAFSCAGMATGLLATIATAIVCTYCSYILVKCAHTLYFRVKVNAMSYSDIAEVAFANGPKSLRRWSKFARLSVMSCLFITYFGAISVYTVIAGTSFKQVIEFYSGYEMNIRIYILCILPPLAILSLIPNLKALTPFSAAANIFIATGLGITLYYLVFDMKNLWELRQTPKSLGSLPATFSITVFAMEAIGLMMPLENNMKNPTHFLGICGVLNRGMSVVSMVYILVGFIGYLKYGDDVVDNIVDNLPVNEIAPQIAKICIGLSVTLTYVLQFFVCLEIGWNAIKDKFVKKAKFYNKLFRVSLVSASVLLAITVPRMGPFVSLIGAFCFSSLGILFPVFIELVTYWESTSIPKLLLRNSPVIIFGIMALCFGTYTSLLDIANIYLNTSKDNVLVTNNGTQPLSLATNATAIASQ